jgi:hypothetical protein
MAMMTKATASASETTPARSSGKRGPAPSHCIFLDVFVSPTLR